jgi:hypothetical protein
MEHGQRQWNDEWTQLTVTWGPDGIGHMELTWNPVKQEPSKQEPSKQEMLCRIKRPQPEVKSCYSAEEISLLSDARLLKCFTTIKGVEELYCSHCRRSTPVATNWMYSIRKRSTKHGLSPDTAVPKTCDVQIQRNDKCNPINNIAYNTVRRTNVSDEVKHSLFQMRLVKMEEMGIQTRPRIYQV